MEFYKQVRPPSITKFEPVIYEDASEHKKIIAALYSSSLAILPNGINSEILDTNSSG